MKYCPKCYVGVKDDDVVCRKCGEVLRPDLMQQDMAYSDNAPSAQAFPFGETVAEEPAAVEAPVYQAPEEKTTPQPVQQAAPKTVSAADNKSETISLGQWMLTLLLLMIPLVNIIMLIVWAVSDTNPSKKNFARAQLIWIGISIGIAILIGATMGVLLVSIMTSLY